MKYEQLITGLKRYINAELIPTMTETQEFLFRLGLSTVLRKTEKLKEVILSNTFLKTFDIIDAEGNINAEDLFISLREQLEERGKLVIQLPYMPTWTFKASDVEVLKRYVME